jgi:tetratricopeptide (TPR) repeat protein
MLYFETNEFQLSYTTFKIILKHEKFLSTEDFSKCLFNLGNSCMNIGNLEEAEDFYAQSIELMKKYEMDQTKIADSLYSLGYIFYLFN